MEGINGSEVPNMDLIFQIYNLLQLMTYSIVIGKPQVIFMTITLRNNPPISTLESGLGRCYWQKVAI